MRSPIHIGHGVAVERDELRIRTACPWRRSTVRPQCRRDSASSARDRCCCARSAMAPPGATSIDTMCPSSSERGLPPVRSTANPSAWRRNGERPSVTKRISFAVGRPAGDVTRLGTQIGQARRVAAVRRHDVDFRMALFAADESDEATVGREARRGAFADAGGQPARHPAADRDRPQIVFAHKDDIVARDRRLTVITRVAHKPQGLAPAGRRACRDERLRGANHAA